MPPLLATVIAPFFFACLTPFLSKLFHRRLGWFVLLIPGFLVAFFASKIPSIASGGTMTSHLSWIPVVDLDLSFRLNGLSLIFSLLITGIGTLVVGYSIFYLSENEPLNKFYLYILTFMGSMLGVVLADNLLLIYVFWELTSVSSFLLIGFWYAKDESRSGALKALLITVLGGFAILAGMVLIYLVTGTFDLGQIFAQRTAVQMSPFYPWIVSLILLGAFTKSAQIPFHIWLPTAMAAPTPVSAYLHSATMVKAGVFLVAKLAFLLGGTHLWFYLISGVGMATLLTGAFLAVQADDLKAILAYSTISQLGFMMTMFGFGTEAAVTAGALHILNHGTFKGALFMVVGIVDHTTGTRLVSKLSGLRRFMPVTAVLAAIPALSMAGVPPFNGFISKELVFEALLSPPVAPNLFTRLLPIVAVLGSALTTAYCLIVGFKIFSGKPMATKTKLKEASAGLLLGPAVLVALVIFTGLVPSSVRGLTGAAATAITRESVHPVLMLWHGITPALWMSIIALALGVFVFRRLDMFRHMLGRLKWTRFHGNMVYDKALDGLYKSSEWVTNIQMTGLLRDYILFIGGFMFLLVGYGFLRSGIIITPRFQLAPITWYEGLLMLFAAIAVVTVLFAQRRLVAVITLGLLGSTISVLWVLLRAPDLALTQIMVEAVSTVLLFLVLAYLPQSRKIPTSRGFRMGNLIIAVGSGCLVSLGMWLALNQRSFQPISNYYADNSLPLAGGRNIVNVILVDFRGFDTMGEITVLTIAGLAVYAAVRLRIKSKTE